MQQERTETLSHHFGHSLYILHTAFTPCSVVVNMRILVGCKNIKILWQEMIPVPTSSMKHTSAVHPQGWELQKLLIAAAKNQTGSQRDIL